MRTGPWTYWTALLLVAVAALPGCRRAGVQQRRGGQAEQAVLQRWGRPLRELPAVKLSVITPHNENIQNEFEEAFQFHHALAYGERVELEWVDVGGGGSSIERYIHNVYREHDTSRIDVMWGGGDFTFVNLTRPTIRHEQGLLEPMTLPAEILEQIPAEHAGVTFRDPKLRWVGTAVSGFGFLTNAGMIRRCNLGTLPRQWNDLGEDRFTDLLVLADPLQSSSVANVYRLIVASADDWQAGWQRLIMVLSNAKRISDSAGQAVNAPALGDALIAASIDFYGMMREVEAPAELEYVSPAGQTPFTPDPVGILRNPPNPEIARRFVEFVLSRPGQALWALPAGDPDGPVRSVLGRLPIRRDVYEAYAGRLIPQTVNFYRSGQTMRVSDEMARIHFEVLRMLVTAAAVDNTDLMRAARRRLNELQANPAQREEYQRRLAIFTRLPDNVDTLEEMNSLPRQFRLLDQQRAEQIAGAFRAARGREMTEAEKRIHLAPAYRRDLRAIHRVSAGWRDYFRGVFREVAR